MEQEIKELLEKNGQEHIIRLYERLSSNKKVQLLNQIKNMNFDEIARLFEITKTSKDFKETKIEPIKSCNADELSSEEKERYIKVGIDAIRSGKLAVVMMAGRTGN